ncbi:MAG TPA: FadR family transcriptional regulator [Firmicutes bacterium]|jgi:GntR family transcriptional regulator, transcriptional repressor for pyruvate dehydrogenase complex|nr:FadR family transcriptional regulator [Bacillota bacterium]
MKKIKRLPLQSEIIEYVKTYIEENNLKTGDRLPSQGQMIEMMGVSRSSLREALKVLETKNIIEILNGKGVYVKNGSPNEFLAQIEFGKEKESILELLEARKILEREIIHLVIQNAGEEELNAIEEILSIILAKYEKGERQNIEDKQFHLAIYNACHNRIMYQLIISVENLLAKLWEFPLGLKEPFTDTIPLHKELFIQIRRRNVKKAQAINDKIIHMICDEIKIAY